MKIAQDLDEENKKRQAMEQEIVSLAIKKIDEDPNIKDQKVIVVASEGWHKGVIGIVASRITERYYKPSIVISIEEDGNATGSARSIEGFSLYEALCHSQGFLSKFGGHDMAAGLSLDKDKINGFRDHINVHAKPIINKEMLRRKMKIDCELSESQVNIPLAEALEELEPYGIGNPTPVFAYKAKVYNTRAIGADGSHLKMQLYTPDRLIDAIGFSMAYQERVIAKDETVMIAGNLQKNEWLGKVTPQLVIKDIKSPDDEVRKSNYFLSLYKEMPEPTVEKLKVFTNTSENCYISSYEDTLKHMIPTRDDAIAIYRYLKQLSMAKIHEESMHALLRESKRAYMSEYKAFQILDIFTELGLLAYKYHNKNGIIKFKIIEGAKNDLANSIKYKQLSKLNESI